MAMVIDDRLHVWDDKDRPRVHVVPACTQYYAPQAEVLFSNEKKLELAWGKQELWSKYKLLKKLHARAEAALCLWLAMVHILPDGLEAIKEAGVAWRELNAALEYDDSVVSVNGSRQQKGREKQCSYSFRRMNATRLGDRFVLKIPFGLIQGSSITIIGTPDGLLGNFKLELTGAAVPGEPDPPIMLHYNVRLLGDKLTEDPVIVKNTWTIADDWGSEDRCPFPDSGAKDSAKEDDLEKCSSMVGNDQKQVLASKLHSNISSMQTTRTKNAEPKKYFPFRQGYLAIAILRVGAKGIHMPVHGKYVTSFAFREDLEPGFVGEVRIAGDIKLLSVIASGLPTTEDFVQRSRLLSIASCLEVLSTSLS